MCVHVADAWSYMVDGFAKRETWHAQVDYIQHSSNFRVAACASSRVFPRTVAISTCVSRVANSRLLSRIDACSRSVKRFCKLRVAGCASLRLVSRVVVFSTCTSRVANSRQLSRSRNMSRRAPRIRNCVVEDIRDGGAWWHNRNKKTTGA